MRYWDDEHPEWDADERAFATAWRNQPKWVVSRSQPLIGPNATLIGDDLERAVRALKAEREGEIEVAGPDLAHSLTELRSEEHTSELQSLMRISYAVFCLKKKICGHNLLHV